MRIWLSIFIALLMAAPAAWAADEPVFSGLQPGEKLTPFKVLIATGSRKGQEADLIAEFAGAPTMLVFVHELTRPGAALMRPLDTFQRQRAADGLKLGFVVLSQDRAQSEQHLPLVANSLRLAAPLTISLDGREGPGNYGLNRNVQITVLVARENRVTASFALVQPNETDAPKVLAEVVKLIGGAVPSLEELGARRAMAPGAPADRAAAGRGAAAADTGRRGADGSGGPAVAPARPPTADDFAALRREIDALRARSEDLAAVVGDLRREVAQLQGRLAQEPPRAAPAGRTPATPLPGAPPSDEGLKQLLRRLIRLDAPAEEVDKTAQELTDYVGANRELRKQAHAAFVLALHLNYGSPHSREVMRRLQAQYQP